VIRDGLPTPNPFIKVKNFDAMKRLSAITIITGFLIVTSGYFATLPGKSTTGRPALISYETITLDTLTIYNPAIAQCDQDPFITASNKRIDPHKLKEGTLRWIAVSRDQLKRWGGSLHYGDTIQLHANDKSIDGAWVVQDTMNKRFKRRADLLFDSSIRSIGMWTGVSIVKRKTYNFHTGKHV
jgi:hypothetical protein